jgi:tetratricopeptide (TPR) repeat protein
MKKFRKLFTLVCALILFSCVQNKNEIQVTKNDSVSTVSTKSLSLINLKADIAYNTGKYDESIKFIDEMINNDSTSGDLYFKKGVCHAKLGFKAKAINSFFKAVELEYRVSDSYFNISLAYASLLNDSLAIVYINKCLSLNPNYTIAQELAKSFMKIHKTKMKGKNVDI